MTMRLAEQRWRDNIVDVLLRTTMVEGSSDRKGTPVPVVRADRMVAWAKACIAHNLSCASEMAAVVTVASLASVIADTNDVVSTAVGCLTREARLSAHDAERAILAGSTMATGGSARAAQARALLIETMDAMWSGEIRPSAFELTNMIEQLASLRAMGGVAVSVADEPVEVEQKASDESADKPAVSSTPESVPGAPLDTQAIADAYQVPREALDEIARIVRESSMQAVKDAIASEVAQMQMTAEQAVQSTENLQPEEPVAKLDESILVPASMPVLAPASDTLSAPSESVEKPVESQTIDDELKPAEDVPVTEDEWIARLTDEGSEQDALDLLNILITDPGGWESGDDVAEYAQSTMEVAAGQDVADDSVLLTLITQRMNAVDSGIRDCNPEQCTQFLIQLVHLKLPEYVMPDDVFERVYPLGEVLVTGQVPLWGELLRAVGYINNNEPLTYDIDMSGDGYRNLVNGYINFNDESDETQYLYSKALGPRWVSLDRDT